ncbi:MAG: type VI secretion system tube protein Hcp [Candidatus Hydrogenedentes bacterium]|nr:type VI secretion system tube protein Hcp [Candidatus Hydrogenedentota bacterium]
MRKAFVYGVLALSAVLAVWMHGSLVNAGPLTPPGAPASSSITLNEIGERIEELESSKFRAPDFPTSTDATVAGSVIAFLEDIEGPVQIGQAKGGIGVLGFSHEIVSPRDAASGLPTGKRQHKPITITKRIDKSTPLLMQSLVNNALIPTAVFRFLNRDDTGKVVNYYTIELENVYISSIISEAPHFEEVSFVYQKITWTFEDGGITAQDDWESPVS